jgi:hypothetical protein
MDREPLWRWTFKMDHHLESYHGIDVIWVSKGCDPQLSWIDRKVIKGILHLRE